MNIFNTTKLNCIVFFTTTNNFKINKSYYRGEKCELSKTDPVAMHGRDKSKRGWHRIWCRKKRRTQIGARAPQPQLLLLEASLMHQWGGAGAPGQIHPVVLFLSSSFAWLLFDQFSMTSLSSCVFLIFIFLLYVLGDFPQLLLAIFYEIIYF